LCRWPTIANVVTYDAVVAIHDVTARLKPGMTANVTISVAKRPNVLTVPAAALLFKPRVGSSAPAAAPAGPGGPGVLGATVTTATPPPLAGAPGSRAVVWTLSASKTPQPVQIVIGMSDGVNFEVRSGALKEGDKVIIGMLQSRSSRTSTP